MFSVTKGKNIPKGNKWSWENQSATYLKINLDYFLPSYAKINFKWVEDLNVRPETIKLLEKTYAVISLTLLLEMMLRLISAERTTKTINK